MGRRIVKADIRVKPEPVSGLFILVRVQIVQNHVEPLVLVAFDKLVQKREEIQGLLFWSSCGGKDGQTLLGTGEESFAELREELFVETFGEEREREGMELAGFDSAMTGLVLG